MAPPVIKICGITRLDDARHAVECGATHLGFVFWLESPRATTPDQAKAIIATLPDTVTPVGVFVNESVEGIRAVAATSGIRMVQLHGDEDASYAAAMDQPILRAISVDEATRAIEDWPDHVMLLVDARDPVRRGGTGSRVDWAEAANVARKRRIVLAGGLTPDNVADAIRIVSPQGVDVSSGVEAAPGIKDADKVARFVASARQAFGSAVPVHRSREVEA